MENQSKTKFPLGGVVLIGLGLLFLLNNLDVLSFHEFVSDYWPLFLIFIGIYIIYTSNRKQDGGKAYVQEAETISSENQVRLDKTFGNIRTRIDSNPFEGGQVKTVFGEIDIEVPFVKLSPGTQKLEIASTFGEVRVQLANDLPVKIIATNLGGTIQIYDQHREGLNERLVYQSDSYETASSRLDIICSVTFGEIRIW